MKKIKILFSLMLTTLFVLVLASCTNVVDKLKLDTSNLEGKSFNEDGIGIVELGSVTDGDTANFFDSDGTYVTLRFFSVDTPESTGDVDKWGLAASRFTKDKLENAVSIILESDTGGAPKKDTYQRYLGYVWYKSSEDDEYTNLNLELVAEGYSKNTSKATGKYVDYFNEAQEYAEKKKLHIWSNEDDPLFSSEPMETDLKYINEHKEELYYKMVMFNAYIKQIDGQYITVEQVVDNELYTFTVYLHNTSATFLKTQGNLVKIVGTVQTYNDEYQISGIKYNQIEGENSALVTQGYYLTFGYEINAATPKYSFENLKVSSVTKDGDNYVFVGTTTRIRSTVEVNVTFTVPATEEINVNDYINKEIKFVGYNENGTKSDDVEINMVVRTLSDIIVQ